MGNFLAPPQKDFYMTDCPSVGYELQYTAERKAWMDAEFQKDLDACQGETPPPPTQQGIVKGDMSGMSLSNPPFARAFNVYADALWKTPTDTPFDQIPPPENFTYFAGWIIGISNQQPGNPITHLGINSSEGLEWWPFQGFSSTGTQHPNWDYNTTSKPIQAKMLEVIQKAKDAIAADPGGSLLAGAQYSWYNNSFIQKDSDQDSEIQLFLNDPESIMHKFDFLATSAYNDRWPTDPVAYDNHFRPKLIANQIFNKPILSYVRGQINDQSLTLHDPVNWRANLQTNMNYGHGFMWWENPGNFTPATPGMQDLIDEAIAVQKTN